MKYLTATIEVWEWISNSIYILPGIESLIRAGIRINKIKPCV